ncbi:MAG: ribosome-binding factor A [Candidatus Taylorbacteria bacterium]|nr:ribosome-binding factor A [Candidatus Taylorbacteria bacterium]
MEDNKSEKIKEQIRELASQFLQRESNHLSLITVTNTAMSKDNKSTMIYFTVLPDTKEKAALDFAKRKRSEFREYVMKNSRMQRIPFFDFAIDEGEKNRQLIDRLSV